MPTSYKAAFVINARNKGPWVAQAVRGALAQTYPCHIVLSDQGSDDDTFAQMERAAADSPSAAEHKVDLVRCPIGGAYGMVACNLHFDWCIEQTDAEWIFQCSADDNTPWIRCCAGSSARLDRRCHGGGPGRSAMPR